MAYFHAQVKMTTSLDTLYRKDLLRKKATNAEHFLSEIISRIWEREKIEASSKF